MKTKTLFGSVAAVLVLLVATAWAFGVSCPLDGMTMTLTGRTMSDSGKILQEHKCPRGHVQWVVQ